MVGGLAYRAAGMMQPRKGIGELHEILESGERSISAPALEVVHERRAVSGREDHVSVADPKRALRVARMLDKGRGRALQDRTQQSDGKADPLARDVGAGLAPQPQSVFVAAELDSDLLEDRVGRRFDAEQTLLADELVSRYSPLESGDDGERALSFALPPGSPSAFARGRLGGCFGHVALRSIFLAPRNAAMAAREGRIMEMVQRSLLDKLPVPDLQHP